MRIIEGVCVSMRSSPSPMESYSSKSSLGGKAGQRRQKEKRTDLMMGYRVLIMMSQCVLAGEEGMVMPQKSCTREVIWCADSVFISGKCAHTDARQVGMGMR